jgi:hypothetical protein
MQSSLSPVGLSTLRQQGIIFGVYNVPILYSLPASRNCVPCAFHIARDYVLSVLSKAIEVGELHVTEGGSTVVLGKAKEGCRPAHILVVSDLVWWRIFTYVASNVIAY